MRPVSSVLPDSWAHVLDDVDATLREAERAAAQRAQAISHFAPFSAADQRQGTWPQHSLERLEKLREGWPAALQQADNETANADEVLKAQEEALHHWLGEAEVLERRLAKWVTLEV
jgi:hypothetical protein